VFAPDGTGQVQFNSLTNYNYTTAQIGTQAYTAIANKDYVDNGNRETVHSLAVDVDGNLLWTSDSGSTGATLDASTYQEFTYLTRGCNLLINNTTGNLQITY